MLPSLLEERTVSDWRNAATWQSRVEDALQHRTLEGQALRASYSGALQLHGMFVPNVLRPDALNNYLLDLVHRLSERLVDSDSQPSKVFAAKVYGVPGVQSVYCKIGDDQVVYLWTVVKADVYELREQIYGIEAEMYDLFPLARFDFLVLTLERLKKKNVRSHLPSGFVRLTP